MLVCNSRVTREFISIIIIIIIIIINDTPQEVQ